MKTRPSEMKYEDATGHSPTDHNESVDELKSLNAALVTARKAALNLMEDAILSEEALRKSELKYRTLFESIDQGFCIIELQYDDMGMVNNYRFLETNPAFSRQTLLQDALMRNMKELKPNHEDYWFKIYGEVAKTGEPKRFQHYASQLGEGIWYDVYAFRMDEPQKNHVAVLFNNINDRFYNELRKEFILKLSELLRPLADSLLIEETAMKVLGTSMKVNRAFYGELQEDEDTLEVKAGYANQVFPLEGSFSISSVGSDLLNHKYQLGETVVIRDVQEDDRFSAQSKEAFDVTQVRAAVGVPLVKNGKIRAILSIHQSEPRDWKGGEIELLEESAELIWASVERAKAEEALRKSEEQLRDFNASLEKEVVIRTKEIDDSRDELSEKNKQLNLIVSQLESFNYLASHDLREPLRKIQMYVDLVNKNRDNEIKLNQYLASINESTARMSQLIEDLLEYSRLSQAKDAFQQVNLNDILAHVKTDYEILIQEKGAILEQDRLPIIRAIPFQMHQLFSNLISNALKFNKGQPIIDIKTRILPSGQPGGLNGAPIKGPFVEIMVTDNGIGFDDQYNKKIFELFQRLHGKSEFPGTGVGLSIVDKIVKNHQGYIEAHGEENKGAVFTIWLPIE